MQTTSTSQARALVRRGFTLLELLIVVAILAVVAGGLIAAYDGLETKSAEGVSAFNIGALNGVIRQYRATNASQYPNDFDSLMFSASGNGAERTALNILPDILKGKIGPYQLTDEGVSALREVGITSARYVTGATANADSMTYDNSFVPGIPNRVFDDLAAEGFGVSVPFASGMQVAAVEAKGLQSFSDGTAPAISGRLNEYFGLDSTAPHVAVVFGIGNRSTLVHSADQAFDFRVASLGEAPFYQKVKPTEYGRYLAVFLLASGQTGDSVVGPEDFFSEARFLGVIDTRGDHRDEEAAEYNGTKT